MNNFSLLEQAAKSIINNLSDKPSPELVVEDLLEREKLTRMNKERYSFEQLLGNWRLCFITGTKKTRSKAGVVLGAGRYIPRLFKIQISYSQKLTNPQQQQQSIATGKVENSVEFGLIKLSFNGPVKFLVQKNILAFDFTRITVSLMKKKLFEGEIRGGKRKEEEFYQESISKQAFFTYFFLEKEAIAARGRGGGLALWGREL